MADSFLQVAADSTGKKLDTRTEGTNSEHRQVVVLGDPGTNAGVAAVDATNGLSVNVTNSSLTVGTHAVTQSGTWTVQPGNTANTTPWLSKLHDGTNAVAVKAASTAPVATDPALVVALSPNGLNANGSATSANSAPMVIASDQATLAIAQDTSKIMNGVTGTSLTPKFAKVTASSSGATTIVAAVTSKKIRVLAWDVVANAAVNFKWQSHVTPTDLTGLYYMAGQGNGVARSFNPCGYFETVAGEALDINLSGAVAVGGSIVYVEV